jgi:hypothetical protein
MIILLKLIWHKTTTISTKAIFPHRRKPYLRMIHTAMGNTKFSHASNDSESAKAKSLTPLARPV